MSQQTGKNRIKIRVDNSSGLTSLKSAEKLVKRGRARWVTPTTIHIIADGERPLPRAHVPPTPRLMWPAWYQPLYADKPLPYDAHLHDRAVFRFWRGQGMRASEEEMAAIDSFINALKKEEK